MINSLWKVVMKIPGTTKVQLSLLTILATSSVTSTSLLISQQVKSTSVESTLCKNVNQREESVELLLSQIGRSIMEVPRTQSRHIQIWKGQLLQRDLIPPRNLGKGKLRRDKTIIFK